MKIAFVSPYDYSYPGGVNAHILNLKKQFSRLGHEVKIIAPASRKAEYMDGNFFSLGRTVPIPSGGSFARMSFSFWRAFPLRRMLMEEKFDLIHIHEPLSLIFFPVIAHVACCPRIGTFHAYHRKPRGYFWGRFYFKRWFKKLNGLIAVSEVAKEFISRHFPGDYEVIPNGVDLELFCPEVSPIPEFMDSKKNILFVGRPEPRKGVEFLIQAYREVKRKVPESRLILAGPGRLSWKRYQPLLWGLKDVVIVQQVPYHELPAYYASAEVVCSPATGEESFGMVLLEAMAMAKPVVATDIPGYRQLVSHQEGILVPPADEVALASALLEIITQPDLARRMGKMGREKALEYDWQKIALKLLEYYRRFL